MIDFNRINQESLGHLETLLPELLPGGRVVGHEYCCGDLAGGHGLPIRWAETLLILGGLRHD